MKNKFRLFAGLTALFFLVAAGAFVLDRLGLMPWDRMGGVLMGLGAGGGCFCLSNAAFARYYQKNEKARRTAEIEEKDERTQIIRGQASYRALLASTPIFLAVWAVLLSLDVSLWAILAVCAGYLAHFGVYLYHLIKLQNQI